MDEATDRLDRLLVSPDATLREAMYAIDRGEYEIALMVERDRTLRGVVTDGDVRRALLAGRSLDDPALPHASLTPLTVDPSAPRANVLDLMRARGISQVPVVDGDHRLVGIHKMRELLGSVDRANWALIMAGGRGQRLGSITEEVPKPMLPVAGRPLLERIVLHLVGHGLRRIFLSVNYLADVIHDHFGDGSDFGCRIEYIEEDEPLGTAGSLALLRDVAGVPSAPVLVMNGDVVTQFSVGDLLDDHVSTGAAATVAAHEHLYQVPYGVLDLTADGRVSQIIEKPRASWHVNAGIYVLDPDVFADLRLEPADMTEMLTDLLARGRPVGVWLLDGDWIDVGHPSQLRAARGHM